MNTALHCRELNPGPMLRGRLRPRAPSRVLNHSANEMLVELHRVCTGDPERELNLFQPRREIVERRTAESLGYYVAELHCRSTRHRFYWKDSRSGPQVLQATPLTTASRYNNG